MKKIPVLDTIRYAYAFTFGHLGTIIGLIWLPMLIFSVAGYFVMSHYYATVPDAIAAGDPTAVGQAGLLLVGWSIVSLLLSAIMYTAVTRQALGLREGPAVVHFAIGAPELRVFSGMLGLFAIMFVFLMIYGVVMGAVRAGLAHAPALGALAATVSVLGLMAIFYAMVRLSFLFLPASIAQGRIGLADSWQLTKGNFWRIFAVGLAIALPIVIIIGASELMVLGPDVLMPKAPPAGADSAQQMQAMAAQMRMAAKHLPLLSGLSFLFAPFVTGLTIAPAAFAYRALVPPQNAGHSGFSTNA